MLSEETAGSHDPRRSPERPIVFIGFMGAGKTRVGTLVAARLGVPFIDTDDLIEQRSGRAVSDIFADDGEDAFRALETDAIRFALDGARRAISVGGGAATREENWTLLREFGALTIYLKAGVETILSRVAHKSHRPLLAGLSRDEMRRKIGTMLGEREPWYERADLVISSDDTRDKYEMAEIVAARVCAAGDA